MKIATASPNRTTIRRAGPRLSARGIAMGIALSFFIPFCVLPVIYMLAISFTTTDGSFSLVNYHRLLTESRRRSLLLTSSMLGAGTAVLATLVGAPLGLLLARADLPVKRVIRLVLIIPLVVPPYILGLAWIYTGGSAGLIARMTGRDLFSDWTSSLSGAIVVLGICYYPLSMLATESAARRVDGRLEEAAMLVAHPRRVLARITLPLIAPAMAAAALIIFVLAVSEFGVPGLLRVRVFTTEVFTAFSALFDFGAATALASPLLVVALLAGWTAKALISDSADRLLAPRRTSVSGLPLALGKWRVPALIFILLIIATFVTLPLMILAAEAGRAERIVSAVSESRQAITNSLVFSTVSATLIVLVAILLGYWQGRTGPRMRRLADIVFILIFAVPSTVTGIGIIGLWNRTGWPGEIYSSPAIVVIACLARFIPLAALILATSVRQVPASFEEAAEVAGAGWPRIFTRIILPNISTGVGAAWVVSFIFAFGELGATALVAPPGESTLPLRIYTIIANAPSSTVAALALAQTGIILVPLALFGILVRGKRAKS